jgi:internalin A
MGQLIQLTDQVTTCDSNTPLSNRLNLDGNPLSSIPADVRAEGDTAILEYLTLNPYQVAERRIAQAAETNAAELDLSNMALTSIPPEIGTLRSLQALYLSGNQLTSLPPEIADLSNLSRLNLSDNQLKVLAPELANLTNLTELYLSNNQLLSLPPEIGSFRNLRWLILAENGLTSLPPEIGNLANLQILMLQDNQLSVLPPEIGNLSNLCSLMLEGNRLENLPRELGQLNLLADGACGGWDEAIGGIYLEGNPLVFPSAEIVAGGTAEILAALRVEPNDDSVMRYVIGGIAAFLLLVSAIGGFMLWRNWSKQQVKGKR